MGMRWLHTMSYSAHASGTRPDALAAAPSAMLTRGGLKERSGVRSTSWAAAAQVNRAVHTGQPEANSGGWAWHTTRWRSVWRRVAAGVRVCRCVECACALTWYGTASWSDRGNRETMLLPLLPHGLQVAGTTAAVRGCNCKHIALL